jgi:hypothetical protein
LFDTFPIQTGLKQGDALTPLLFNFPSEYAIRKAQENHVGLKLNVIHHRLPVHSDDINQSGDNRGTIRKNTEILIDASNKVGLIVKAEKTLLWHVDP